MILKTWRGVALLLVAGDAERYSGREWPLHGLSGANHANGVPLNLFASGEARWLGVRPEGQAEQARAQLVSVPYALTAGDAQTLGGKPLSAFVLASAANGGTTVSGAVTNRELH